GMAKTKIFKNGVIITKDTQKGHPIYDLGDTLVDEVLIKNEETGVITKKSTEYPIIGIANKAFQDINTMTNLIIGRFVREIGYCAFDNCNKLKKVDFNDNSELTTIGDFAFQDTKAMGITSPFTIPDKVTYLGNFAFRYSGWSNTTNNGINQSILHIKPNYNFIGVKCFFNTQFQSVIFEPGCYFESQINAVDGHQLEVDAGWTIAHKDQNQIGANIFADCPKLNSVIFRNETEGVENTIVTPALNIIPDNAFDSGNYPLDNLSVLQFNEGVQYIGKEAFRYQDLITEITLPNSLEEVDVEAFYNCSNVLILNIGNEVYGLENSLLESLHTRAFANLINIDRVIINSKIFSRYGNGPFLGCSKLKSIEFPNITDISNVPRGYSELENPSEVQIGRVYSDFLYGTFETGEMGQDGTGEIDDTLPKTYSVPTRIFCNKGTGGEVLQRFKDNILAGKELKAGSTSSGTRNWRDTIFVYDIGLVFRNYSWEEGKSTDIALQEIYNFPDRTVVSYNLAFWSARTSEIKIPSSVILTINGDTKERIITELGMYCLPTCVTTVTIPASITRIEHDAFNNCSQLQTVTFEDKDTLEYIGENAFVGTKISSFTGGKNLQVVGQYAFWRCINLVWADFSQCTKITNKKSGSGYRGRISLKTQYKFEYELTAIDEADTDNDDAIDYIDAFHYGVFQACKSLAWVYLPPNIARMSRSLFEGCKDLRTVIIENDSISTETDYNDEDECCFYENNQPRTVYETTALDHTGEFIIYGINLDNHRFIFPNCTYEILYPDNPPSKP
ncbi:MAG: leucine-rich repeat domain-containing protein, partial [Clostridia bacterium]